MSDRIYTDTESLSNDNFVLVCQSAETGKLLTKRNYRERQVSYDRIFLCNFFEISLHSLTELYVLSKRMLDKPKCCFIRARIKDLDKRFKVRRTYKNEDATLVLENCNWIALDVDWQEVESTGNLVADANTVLLALPSVFTGVECFVVASASYGIKPGIRMRMFFWSREPVSNADIKRVLVGYEKIVDPAIFAPIQPIYTAKPIFVGMDDPVKERIAMITPPGVFGSCVEIRAWNEHYRGAPEKWYTKRKAEAFLENSLLRIADFSSGDRHDGLITEGYLIGKLVGQGHFEREPTIQRMYDACDYWSGKRDTKKDMDTIIWSVDRGISSLDKETVQ